MSIRKKTKTIISSKCTLISRGHWFLVQTLNHQATTTIGWVWFEVKDVRPITDEINVCVSCHTALIYTSVVWIVDNWNVIKRKSKLSNVVSETIITFVIMFNDTCILLENNDNTYASMVDLKFWGIITFSFIL